MVWDYLNLLQTINLGGEALVTMDIKYGCAKIGGDGISLFSRGLCHKMVEYIEG